MTTNIVYRNPRPTLMIESIGSKVLGRCYSAQFWHVTSQRRLSRAVLSALNIAGVLGFGQEFRITSPCDGTEEPTGVDHVPAKYKEDGMILAFYVDDIHNLSTRAGIEILCSMALYNVEGHELRDPLAINLALDAGDAVYRQDKGQIYSSAINLAAHMGFGNGLTNALAITERLYEHVEPRIKKAFFKDALFEGTQTYVFERIC